MSLRVVPCSLAQANAYVSAYHRHNGPLPSSKFAVAVVDEHQAVRGVAVCGLPKARMAMAGPTLEVSRVCTDGVRNGCSILYGACTRAARAMGYARAITYTLDSELGASLKASGWTRVASTRPDSWTRHIGSPGRGLHDEGAKSRWEIRLADAVEPVWPEALDPQLGLDFG